MYKDFTIEERITLAAIFTGVYKKVIENFLVQPLIILKNNKLEAFEFSCINIIAQTFLDESIRQNSSISKFVWNNMRVEHKKIILAQLCEVEKVVKGEFTLEMIVMQTIMSILDELDVRSYSHDENGFHFKQYDI